MATLELGGNIELTDFEQIEKYLLVVVKKVVGNYAKKISEIKEFNKLNVTLDQQDSKFDIKAKLITNQNEHTTSSVDPNLFFALDHALSKLITEIKK